MNPFTRLRGVWRRMGVTTKFTLAFSLLLGLIVIEAVAGLAALGEVRHAEAVILASVEIRQHIFEMDGNLEKARRLHRDFFLQYPHIGFRAAQELYFRPSTEIINHVVTLSEELQNLIEHNRASAALRERNNDLALYLAVARRFSGIFRELVGEVTKLAAPGVGLENRLLAAEVKLGGIVKNSPNALMAFHEMVSHQRRYMVTRQRPDMQSALNAGFELRKALDAAGGDVRARGAGPLDEYMSLARRIPDIDVSIRSKLNDFTLQASAVDPISASLKTLATAEVERARTRIDTASRLSTLIIAAAAVTGLFFAMLVAAAIHASITRKIVTLTKSTEELRAGNLAAAVDIDSSDEIGLLAAAFNDMSLRVRRLVNHLEDMVQMRTRELTETRDRLQLLVRELDDKNRDLAILSVTDKLTDLANRRKLETTLQAELLRFRRYGKPFSVILLDVDHFKNVNDTHGHQAGDAVLVRLAALLSAGVRETDLAGRWGGEEFLVICPETEIEMVASLAERYRVELERQNFAGIGTVTASFGVATSAPGDNMAGLIARADRALYQAKESGRNRVEGLPPRQHHA